MDPINIIVLINFIATFFSNIPSSKKNLKSTVIPAVVKPKSFMLQTIPLVLATVNIFLILISCFGVGTIETKSAYSNYRFAGLALYIVFSWLQILSLYTLGDSFSQNVLLFKNHRLVSKGIYSVIRHPIYLCQILADIGAASALLSYLVAPIAILEIPFYIYRGVVEDKMMRDYFKESFTEYKKKTGFMFPFIG